MAVATLAPCLAIALACDLAQRSAPRAQSSLEHVPHRFARSGPEMIDTGKGVEAMGAVTQEDRSDRYPGVVISRLSVDVPARLDGILVRVDGRPGQRVKRGSLLAVVDSATATRDLGESEAALAIATADLHKSEVEVREAEQTVARTAELRDLVSAAEIAAQRAQLAFARSRREVAQANLAAARARLEFARTTIRDSKIPAPFDGIISTRYADPGASIRVGNPILRIVATGSFGIRFAIPENRIAAMQVGQPIEGVIPALSGTLNGTVLAVSPELDAESRAIFVEGSLTVSPAVEEELAVGLAVQVQRSRGGKVSLRQTSLRGPGDADRVGGRDGP